MRGRVWREETRGSSRIEPKATCRGDGYSQQAQRRGNFGCLHWVPSCVDNGDRGNCCGLAGKKVKIQHRIVDHYCAADSVTGRALRLCKIIEAAGGRFVIDTCPILSPMAEVAKKKGYTGLATNSSKLAHYAPGQWALPTYYGSLQACLNGRNKRQFGER